MRKINKALIIIPVLIFFYIISTKSTLAATFNDNFDRSDSSILENGWVEDIGNWSISSNQLISPIQTETLTHNTTAPTSEDYYVQADGSANKPEDFIAVISRFTNVDNFYLFQSGKGYAQLWKRVAGSWTILYSGPFTRSANTINTYRIEIIGNQISGFIDGSLIASATDNSITSTGTGGLWGGGNSSTTRFDNYEIGNISNPAPTPTPLPSNNFFNDDFNRLTSSMLNNGWIEDLGDWSIGSNQLVSPIQDDIIAHNINAPASADYYTQVKVITTAKNDFAAVLARYSDINNFYLLQLGKGQVELWKKLNGAWIQLDSELLPISQNTFYVLRIEVKGNQVRGYVNDAQVIYATDSSLTTTGHGGVRRGGNTSSVIFDNFNIGMLNTSPENPSPLPVPDLKQYAPPWGPLEYDSARSWNPRTNNPSISRWGCALTSGNMILNFLGYNINPQSLNTLFKNNKGYTSDGGVRWTEIAAYSKLHESEGKPILEFRYKSPDTTIIDEELQNGRPVILKYAEYNPNGSVKRSHFVVAKGKEGSDYLVNDPDSATNTTMAQVQTSWNMPLVSTLTFTPSYTDISYLVFSVDFGFKIDLYDENGNKVEGDAIVEGPITANDKVTPSGNRKSYQTLYIPKPESGLYTAKVSGNGSYTLSSYLLDTQGKNKQQQFNGNTKSGKTANYTIDFNKELSDASQVDEISFNALLKSLETAHKNKKIKNQILYNSLRLLVNFAQSSYDRKQISIAKTNLNLAKELIKRASTPPYIQIEKETAKQLTSQIDLLISSL